MCAIHHEAMPLPIALVRSRKSRSAGPWGPALSCPPLITCEGVKGENRLILLLSTAAFLVCSAAAGAGLFRPFDVLILDLAQRTDSRVLDAVGLVTSAVGGVEFVAVATVALAAGLLVGGRGRLALRLVVAFLVTGLIELAAKTVVPQTPVPEDAMRAQDPSLLDVSTPYPYPSGHVLRSVLLLGAIYLLWPSRAGRVALFIFLAASATSRVYLGTHWPSDVIGGALIGIAGLAWAFEERPAKTARDISEQRNDLTS
jgi:membrane-associated phospholipid phosphatase